MATVHPPARPLLQGTVFLKLVIVFIRCTELHAIVRCVEFVTGVISEIKAVESIPSISTKVISVRQTVCVDFWSNFECGIISIPDKRKMFSFIPNGYKLVILYSDRLQCFLIFNNMFDLRRGHAMLLGNMVAEQSPV